MGPSTQPSPLRPPSKALPGMKIRTDYVPKAKRQVTSTSVPHPSIVKRGMAPSITPSLITQLCPRCSAPIPVHEMAQHMRVELLDPNWRIQQKRAAEKHKDTNLVAGSGKDKESCSVIIRL